MSRYTDLVNSLVRDGKGNMDRLLDISDKAVETLKYFDMEGYNNIINTLEDEYYKITKEEAQNIVRTMRPFGEVWNYEAIKDFIMQKGEGDCIHYYLLMNMARNDFYNTAKLVDAVDDPNFYFQIAKDFINDEDGKRHKVEKYFM